MKAIILSVWVGSRIRPLTDNCPKSLLTVCDKTILERMVSNIIDMGIYEIIIVTWYLEEQIIQLIKEKFSHVRIHFVKNNKYRETSTGYSLLMAKELINWSEFVLFDSDIVFDKKILKKLIEAQHENYLCMDKNLNLNEKEVKIIIDENSKIITVNKELDSQLAIWGAIGIEKIWERTSKFLFQELELIMRNKENYHKYYETAYEQLIEKGFPFYALDITGKRWVWIDTQEGLVNAKEMFM